MLAGRARELFTVSVCSPWNACSTVTVVAHMLNGAQLAELKGENIHRDAGHSSTSQQLRGFVVRHRHSFTDLSTGGGLRIAPVGHASLTRCCDTKNFGLREKCAIENVLNFPVDGHGGDT